MKKEDVISLIDLLTKSNLKIPKYQRPYEWNKSNVYILLEDILERYNKKTEDNSINLGTIILHDTDGVSNIVDGQQRIITLSLLLKALNNDIELNILDEDILCTDSSISKIIDNYHSIEDYINRLEEKDELSKKDFENYLKNKVYFYKLNTTSTEESFQLFDSRNTKYKDLSPVDLLKAYHLGALKCQKEEKMDLLETWNKNINSNFDIEPTINKIDYIYNNVLFRIYNWGLNKEARDFTKDDIFLYKGYKKSNRYSYVKYYKSLDQNLFQINKPFEEGKSFFDMTNYYINKYDKIIKNYNVENIIGKECNDYYKYQLKYVNNLYYNAILLYMDRFGESRNGFYNSAINDYIFKWSYIHRIKNRMVKFSSVNYYVLHTNSNFFFECNKALDISELLSLELEDKGKQPSAKPKDKELLGGLRSELWKKVD